VGHADLALVGSIARLLNEGLGTEATLTAVADDDLRAALGRLGAAVKRR
jgi:hypothetical protein